MEFSNQKRSKRIKRAFNITGIVIVVVGLVFLWMKKDIPFMITVGFFAVFVGISQFANLCYVYFSSDNGRVLIRYYPVISILKKDYESIEFKHQSLANFQIEKSMGFADLEIAIKTKRGIAEYPTISLAAMSKSEIEEISNALDEIMKNNRKGI